MLLELMVRPICLHCFAIKYVKTNFSCLVFAQKIHNSPHGGESHDILHLYSDRTDKNIRHYFFNIQ